MTELSKSRRQQLVAMRRLEKDRWVGPKWGVFRKKNRVFTQFPANVLALVGSWSTEAPSEQEVSENESSGLLSNAEDYQKNDDIWQHTHPNAQSQQNNQKCNRAALCYKGVMMVNHLI